MSITRPFGALYTEDRACLPDRQARRWGWLVIALGVLLVYWPLSTFQYTINGGDTFDCWLPWRWFITLALKNGELPLWNPLQQMGYPVHADLQGPMWYPEAIALGGTIGHSIWTLQALFLLYVVLGGIGFMRLCVVVHGDARIGTVTGLAYALCGFFAAHQMHFYAVISAAWMPWFLAAQLRLMRVPHWRTATEAAVIMMLLLTGGNHTFTIIAAYLVTLLLVIHTIGYWRRGDRSAIGRLLGCQLLFLGLSAVMACGTFQALIEVAPYLDRMQGLSYVWSAEVPFNKASLPTLLFPGIFGGPEQGAGTSRALANGYMGVLMLVLALLAFMRRRTATENAFAVFGLLCALTAMGDELPLHHWIWRWLPGMNVFRFPNYFLSFTLPAVLLLAAGSMRKEAHWRWGRERPLLTVLACVLLAGTGLAFLLPEQFPPAAADALRRSLFERVRAWGHEERMLMGWMITAPVLGVAIVLAWRRKLTTSSLLILVLVEMGWNTHLAMWNTAISDLHPAALHGRMVPMPRGPLVPDRMPLSLNHDSGEALHHLWRNTQTFLGRPSREGFNSFWPSHTYRLLNDHPDLVAAMDRQPMVYLSDQVRPEADMGRVKPDSSTVFVAADPPRDLRSSSGDSLYFTGSSYHEFKLGSRTNAPTFLTVQQTWFPGWGILIDGEPAQVVRANVAAFGCVLPAGEHRMSVRFEKPAVPWLMGISMTFFLAALVVLSLSHAGCTRALSLGGTGALAAMIAWSLLAHEASDEKAVRGRVIGHFVDDPAGTILYQAPGPIPWRLHAGREFTPVFRIGTASLHRSGDRSLLVELLFEPEGRCKALLVVERRSDGRLTSYEAMPVLSPDTLRPGRSHWSMALDMREFRYPEEEVSFYVWNQGPDTLQVNDMRVWTRPRAVGDGE